MDSTSSSSIRTPEIFTWGRKVDWARVEAALPRRGEGGVGHSWGGFRFGGVAIDLGKRVVAGERRMREAWPELGGHGRNGVVGGEMGRSLGG